MSEVISKQMEGLNSREREELLKSYAMKIEVDQDYEKPLSDEQISAAKERYTEESIKRDIKVEKFNEIKSEHNDELKKMNVQLQKNLHIVRTGTEQKKGTLFYIDDQDNKRMYIYNQEGELILDRPLKPEEKQTHMRSLSTGTNG